MEIKLVLVVNMVEILFISCYLFELSPKIFLLMQEKMARSYFKQEHDLGMYSIDAQILDFVCWPICGVVTCDT